jgi:DMSO/TMAO reductase YedYZ molybdopterin-dependent catalytic subunit
MKVRSILTATSLIICFTLLLSSSSLYENIRAYSAPTKAPEWLVVRGLVENQLNLTYSQLKDFPLLSEVVELRCVGIGLEDTQTSVVYNWTGVPLLYLLSMAKVIPGSRRMVVFHSVDGFSSNITLDEAMHPTTILALEANGTDLNQLTGFGSGSRIVLSCRWGYKWAQWVNEIVVADGQESFYTQGLRPNCTMPQTEPEFQSINVAKSFSPESPEYTILTLTNASIEWFDFRSDIRLIFNLPRSQESNEFLYVAFPSELLAGPYSIRAHENSSPISCFQTVGDHSVFLFLTCTSPEKPITIEVAGSYTWPLLQFLGPYYNLWGEEYYNIELTGHPVHLICRYF